MKKIAHWKETIKTTGLLLFIGGFIVSLFGYAAKTDDRASFSLFTIAHADTPGVTVDNTSNGGGTGSTSSGSSSDGGCDAGDSGL